MLETAVCFSIIFYKTFLLQSQAFNKIVQRSHGYGKTQLNPLASVSGQERPVQAVCMPTCLPSPRNTNVFGSYSTQKNPDDVVITLAIRTPLAKGFKGGFKDTDLDYMVYALLKKVVEKSNLDPSIVEDICLGNVRKQRAQTQMRYANEGDRSVMAKRLILSVRRCLPLDSRTPPAPLLSTAFAPRA
jgi:Thiolase, N-terminal domain